MEFILMLIAFFSLNVTPNELSDDQITDLESPYYEAQTANDTVIDGIRREIQTLR